MEVTDVVTTVHGDRSPGRIVFHADDQRLTPFAGLVCVGELARRTGLVELIDAELATERRAEPGVGRRPPSSAPIANAQAGWQDSCVRFVRALTYIRE